MSSSKRPRSRKNDPASSAPRQEGTDLLEENRMEEATPAPAINPVRSIPVRGAPPEDMERIGDILRRVRVHRGEEVEVIADYLRIRPTFLVALESSHYEELPADAYVIGFLRTYANYLGLDGKGAIDQYRREMAGRRRKPQLNMPQPVSEGRAPTVAMMVGAVIAFLLLYGLWYGISSSNRTDVPEPPLPAVSSSAPEKTEPAPVAEEAAPVSVAATATATLMATTTPPVVAPTPVPEAKAQATIVAATATIAKIETIPVTPKEVPAETPQAAEPVKAPVYGDTSNAARIVIKAVADSWVLVADGRGNTVFDRTMKAGETYRVPSGKALTLTTGNAGGLVVSVDGKELPKLGDAKRVIRALALDADKMKGGE